MNTHDKFADDLALYALEELAGDERREFEQHLETCAACRRELHALRGDLGLLGLSAAGPQPPARSKQRLMQAIAAEPQGAAHAQPTRVSQRSWWWTLVPALAALGLLVFAVSLWRTNVGLSDQIAELSNRNQDAGIQLEHLNEQLRLLTAPDAVHVSLNPQKSPHQPSGTAIFSPTKRHMMLMASNLPAVPAGKAYQLWILPANGAPIPAGVFKPDEHGNAMMMDHMMPEGVQVTAFAITMEKEEGSDKPTMPILLMGAIS